MARISEPAEETIYAHSNSYIAHRDPETKRYYLGEDELACLEETLGQLVGYVCTALFSKQEQETSPLLMTVLHEV